MINNLLTPYLATLARLARILGAKIATAIASGGQLRLDKRFDQFIGSGAARTAKPSTGLTTSFIGMGCYSNLPAIGLYPSWTGSSDPPFVEIA
jgi:hypothetical protein